MSATLFPVLRNAEVDLDEEESDTLRDAALDALRERRFEAAVRVDIAPGAASEVRRALLERFELTDDDFYDCGAGLVDCTDLFQIASLDIPAPRDRITCRWSRSTYHRRSVTSRAGKPAGIIAKMNQLEDVDICRALGGIGQALPGQPIGHRVPPSPPFSFQVCSWHARLRPPVMPKGESVGEAC